MINVSQRPAEETPVVPDNTQNTPGNIQPESNTSSGNNYLRYLQLSEEGLTPYFTKNITDYAISVGENVDSIEVLARAEDPNASVEISGNTNLVDGDNIITIKVTAQNGYYRIYTIIVTKSADKEKSNAYLESLIVEGYELNRDFQSEVLEYDIGEILSTVEYLNVVAATKDRDAKIEIIGSDKLVDSGEGEIIIKVTAPDGTTTKEYKIKYTVKAATQEEESEQEMKDYLKDIQDSKGKKELVLSYLKYIWAAIKKNYLLVLMYLLILFEFIYIIVLRRKVKKLKENGSGGDGPDTDPDKTILKVDKKQEEPSLPSGEQNISTSVNIEPPKVDLLEDSPKDETEPQKLGRKGSLEKSTFKAEEISNSSGIKLVDLDKNEGPKDELTFKENKEPTTLEIAERLHIPEWEVVQALNSLKDTVSMFEPIYNDGGDVIYLADQLTNDDSIYDIETKMALRDALTKIKDKERYIIIQRYMIGKTQTELADEIGISQAQISRLEKNGIAKIKKIIR